MGVWLMSAYAGAAMLATPMLTMMASAKLLTGEFSLALSDKNHLTGWQSSRLLQRGGLGKRTRPGASARAVVVIAGRGHDDGAAAMDDFVIGDLRLGVGVARDRHAVDDLGPLVDRRGAAGVHRRAAANLVDVLAGLAIRRDGVAIFCHRPSAGIVGRERERFVAAGLIEQLP